MTIVYPRIRPGKKPVTGGATHIRSLQGQRRWLWEDQPQDYRVAVFYLTGLSH